jgi:hypothetical protein
MIFEPSALLQKPLPLATVLTMPAQPRGQIIHVVSAEYMESSVQLLTRHEAELLFAEFKWPKAAAWAFSGLIKYGITDDSMLIKFQKALPLPGIRFPCINLHTWWPPHQQWVRGMWKSD